MPCQVVASSLELTCTQASRSVESWGNSRAQPQGLCGDGAGGTGLLAEGLRARASRAVAPARGGQAAEEHSCGSSPSVRPAEENKVLKLHTGSFWSQNSVLTALQQHYCAQLGVNYSLCNFY